MAKEFWPVPLPHGAGLILARPDLPNLFILNPTAAFLWSLYQQHPENPAALVQPFASQYGIPLHQAHADITATLHSWSQTLLADPVPPQSLDQPDEPPRRDPHPTDFSLGPTPFRLFIDPNAPDFLDEIRPRLAHLVASSTPSTPTLSRVVPLHVSRSPHNATIRVFANHLHLGSVADAAQARLLLLPEIARLAHNSSAQWFAILHAAALAHPTSNHAVILPAATGSGKSTLTTALLHHAHLRLLSDDSAALTGPHHQLLSLPFALMLRSGSWPLFPQLTQNHPTHLRYGSDLVRFIPPPSPINTTPAIPKHLIFVNYQPDAPPLSLHPLDPLQTFLHLQKAGFWIPHTQPSLTAFVSWVSSLPSYQLTYSDLPAAVDKIHKLLNKESSFQSLPL